MPVAAVLGVLSFTEFRNMCLHACHIDKARDVKGRHDTHRYDVKGRHHTHRYHHRERDTHTYTSATWSQYGSLCRLEGAGTNRHTPPERASPPEQACRLHESKVSVDVGIDFASRSCFGRLSFCSCCEYASSHAPFLRPSCLAFAPCCCAGTLSRRLSRPSARARWYSCACI